MTGRHVPTTPGTLSGRGSTDDAAVAVPGDGLRVSVVVAVYNPGPNFDKLVDSLQRQTLPAEQFEVLLCDDGSDKATQQRLSALAAEHLHFRVLRLPHSGWPGASRNAGIQAAAGRYLFFCDDDDWLNSEALERLCDFADEHGSDVVLGMLVGVGRWLNMRTFRRTVPHARLGTDPLLDFLTPHKLFRTAFLRTHAIVFPVGKVRLEDHQFVLQAYFKATTISIYSDYPVYYWAVRPDRPSITGTRIDPQSYYRDLQQVLDIVQRHTDPGPYRDSLLQHWYRGKVLGRLGGGRVARYPSEYRDNLLEAVHPLLAEWFPPRIDALLRFPFRLRSALVRANDVDGLVALGQVEDGLRCPVRATALHWTEGGVLRATVRATVTTADNRLLQFDEVPREGGPPRRVWRPPQPISPAVLTDDVLDASADLDHDYIQVFIRDLVDQAMYPVTDVVPASETEFTVDPRTAYFGRPVSRRSELLVEVRRAGWVFRRRIRVEEYLLAPGERLQSISGRRELSLARAPKENVVILTARRLPLPPAAPPATPPAAPPPVPWLRRVRDALPPSVRRRAGRLRRRLRQTSSGR